MDIPRNDPFEEYYHEKEPSKRERGYAWHTAMGLQAVDGIVPSEYLKETARKNIEGDISLDQAEELIESYYKANPKQDEERTEEADLVSARIAAILSEQAFVFSPGQYISIHRRLFQGIFSHAGKIRDYNITKREWVLDGDTVMYGGASELRGTLDYDMEQERLFSYQGLTMPEVIHHLAMFVSRLWQIHIFGEGNTRTTAVFFIKYLRSLGFDVTNDIFAKNAWYFRNAMVRANYNNLQKGVHETTEYLERFLRNLLLGEKNELHNRELHISCHSMQGHDPGHSEGACNADHSIAGTFQMTQKENDPINDLISEPIKLSERERKLLRYLHEEPDMTREKLSEALGCSDSTVKREMKSLSDKGVISRIGSRKKGSWIIHTENIDKDSTRL